MNRHITIALGVLVIHIPALWAMQTGLLRRAVEVIVPAEILSELIEPPAPKVVPPPPSPSAPIKQSIKQTVVAKAPIPMETVEPQPLAIADPTPAPNAPVGAIDPPPVVTPVAAPVALAPPAPARVELPSSDADYLQNPAPPYPPLSKRLGEQGKVLVRVLIGVDGTAQKADIKQSSGFERLDQSALSTVLHWRYVPGKRARVPEAMWFNVPINFVLE